ncbi:hypothetical protein GCM10009532_01500 [Microbacterium aurantiacum]
MADAGRDGGRLPREEFLRAGAGDLSDEAAFLGQSGPAHRGGNGVDRGHVGERTGAGARRTPDRLYIFPNPMYNPYTPT